MDSTVIAAMKTELRALDEKAMALRAVIALYEGQTAVNASAKGTSAVARALINRATNADTVLAVARELCHGSDFPIPTRDILKGVEERGVSIAGDVPQNVVSSVLSRSSEFKSNGRIGWTLNENGAAEAAPDAEEAPPSSNESRENLEGLLG